MIKLKVITVIAPDIEDAGGLHTAYTVLDASKLTPCHAVGWTLRDAISEFSLKYDIPRSTISIARPFIPQETYLRINSER